MRIDPRNIALALGSTVFFILFIEVALRVTGLQTTKFTPSPLLAKPYLQNSAFPELGYDLKPGFDEGAHFTEVTINDHGFRGPTIDQSKPHIAVLGDSIAFGYGVGDSETLPHHLREAFPDHNVINSGVPGYNLIQQTITYKKKLARLDPELLVLVFYWNDLTHEEKPPFVDDLGVLRPHGWTPEKVQCRPIDRGLMAYVPGKCWLDLNSTFYLAMKKVVNLRYSQVKSARDRKESQEGKIEDPISSEKIESYASELDGLLEVIPPDLPRVFVIWPDRFIHDTSLPLLIAEAEKRGFEVVNLYDTIGNEFEILSWDYTHPNGNALKDASLPVIEMIGSMITTSYSG